jgi:heat shock protein HslJ
MLTTSIRLADVVLVASLLCAGGSMFAQVSGTDVPADLARFQDVEHRLTEGFVNGVPVKFAENPSPTVSFHSGGVMSGYAGVNQYFANFKVAADGSFTLQSPGFAITRVSGEPQRMDAETTFLNTLRGTTFIRIESDGIAFETGDHAVRLKFTRATATQGLSELLNVELSLVRFIANGREIVLPASPTITLTLQDAGKLSGHSAVNSYAGGFTATSDGNIAIQGLIASQLAGPPELMALETAYFDALSVVRKVEVRGDHVILQNDTTSLEFAPTRSSHAAAGRRPARKRD